MNDPVLVLASASPRRRELLATLGVAFSCSPAHIDETPRPDEAARDYVARMAREKAAVVAQNSTLPVLAADTTVVLAGAILGKPCSHGDALQMLRQLRGRRHCVYTALCLMHGAWQREQVVCTEVDFCDLSDAECEAYIASGEPWDKAGAYAIQGLGGALVQAIHGSYSNVVGLPLYETRTLLGVAGIAGALRGATADVSPRVATGVVRESTR